MEGLVRVLKVFVVVGGIVLVVGTVVLFWMIAQRGSPETVELPVATQGLLPDFAKIPEGSKVEQLAVDESSLYLLLTLADGDQAIALVALDNSQEVQILSLQHSD